LRTAKACGPGTRCWCQVGGDVSTQPGADMSSIRRRRRQDEFVSGESTPYAVKTIAWGMPGDFRCLRCEHPYAYSLPPAHTGLRVHWAPGITRALCFQGERISGIARAQSRGEHEDACWLRVGKAAGARECTRRLRAHHSTQEVGTARDAPLTAHRPIPLRLIFAAPCR
jgi:hypothetical protein